MRLSTCSALSHAGAPCYQSLADGEVLTKNPTHANPSFAEIEVTEVLRGDQDVKRTKARFEPESSGIDWVGGDSKKLTEDWEKAEAEARRQAGPSRTASTRLSGAWP